MGEPWNVLGRSINGTGKQGLKGLVAADVIEVVVGRQNGVQPALAIPANLCCDLRISSVDERGSPIPFEQIHVVVRTGRDDDYGQPGLANFAKTHCLLETSLASSLDLPFALGVKLEVVRGFALVENTGVIESLRNAPKDRNGPSYEVETTVKPFIVLICVDGEVKVAETWKDVEKARCGGVFYLDGVLGDSIGLELANDALFSARQAGTPDKQEGEESEQESEMWTVHDSQLGFGVAGD
jgi:hypothetical protein